MSVDFPEPDGPTRATNSPLATTRSIPRRAWTALPFDAEDLREGSRFDDGRHFAPQLSSSFSTFFFVGSSSATCSVPLRPERISTRSRVAMPAVDRDDVVVVLPVVREPDELAAAVQAFLRVRDLLRREFVLQAVDDGLAVAALERLERDRDGLVLLLAEDLDVRAHAGAVCLAELVERDLDREDLDLVVQLRRRARRIAPCR